MINWIIIFNQQILLLFQDLNELFYGIGDDYLILLTWLMTRNSLPSLFMSFNGSRMTFTPLPASAYGLRSTGDCSAR